MHNDAPAGFPDSWQNETPQLHWTPVVEAHR